MRGGGGGGESAVPAAALAAVSLRAGRAGARRCARAVLRGGGAGARARRGGRGRTRGQGRRARRSTRAVQRGGGAGAREGGACQGGGAAQAAEGGPALVQAPDPGCQWDARGRRKIADCWRAGGWRPRLCREPAAKAIEPRWGSREPGRRTPETSGTAPAPGAQIGSVSEPFGACPGSARARASGQSPVCRLPPDDVPHPS
uniref:Uncharacterized protein n=1 Tax=Rangifer tarandus platyrhynchus TaxID=3082113 RepID=A0ACB0EUT9_RANTA|nr:unnamed protein product [Rangifer tarandus platyrhynchus]